MSTPYQSSIKRMRLLSWPPSFPAWYPDSGTVSALGPVAKEGLTVVGAAGRFEVTSVPFLSYPFFSQLLERTVMASPNTAADMRSAEGVVTVRRFPFLSLML